MNDSFDDAEWKEASIRDAEQQERNKEIYEYWQLINWRKILHNHGGILSHNTCPLCVIEEALYWRRDV